MELSFFILFVLMWLFWSCACYLKRRARQTQEERERRRHLASLELQRSERRQEAVAYFNSQRGNLSNTTSAAEELERKNLIEGCLCVTRVANEEEARNLMLALKDSENQEDDRNNNNNSNNNSSNSSQNVISRAWMTTLETVDNARNASMSPECSICLDCYSENEELAWPKTSKCNHIFHAECIKMWLKDHNECPLCRVNILCSDDVDQEKGPTETIFTPNPPIATES